MLLFLPWQVFTPEGELLLKFGSNGEGNGQFNAPTGVAVDINGNIIVADWGNSRIQVRHVSASQRLTWRLLFAVIEMLKDLLASEWRLLLASTHNTHLFPNHKA